MRMGYHDSHLWHYLLAKFNKKITDVFVRKIKWKKITHKRETKLVQNKLLHHQHLTFMKNFIYDSIVKLKNKQHRIPLKNLGTKLLDITFLESTLLFIFNFRLFSNTILGVEK